MYEHTSEKQHLTDEQCRALLMESRSLPTLVVTLILSLISAGMLTLLIVATKSTRFFYPCLIFAVLLMGVILYECVISALYYIWAKNGTYTVYRDVINSKRIRRRRAGKGSAYIIDYIFCLSYSGKYVIPPDNFRGTDHRMSHQELYTSVLAGEEVFLLVFPNRHVAVLCPTRYFIPPREPKDPPDWGKTDDSGSSDTKNL